MAGRRGFYAREWVVVQRRPVRIATWKYHTCLRAETATPVATCWNLIGLPTISLLLPLKSADRSPRREKRPRVVDGCEKALLRFALRFAVEAC